MKLAKLSLAAIVVAGLASSSFAADTLADAFKNGKVNGELKAYYFSKDNGDNREDLFTTGVTLGYKTASFYGLSAGFTFQGNSSPFADGAVNDNEDLRTGGKGMFQGTEYGTGAQLSEAYLAYTLGKTTAMVGRMFLDTPLVASSSSRMTKDSFEGAAIINTDLPNTTLIAGYVQKFQARTDGEGHVGKFSKTFGLGSDVLPDAVGSVALDNGAFTLAAINKSINGLTLTGAYAQTSDVLVSSTSAVVMDSLKIAYAEAAYEGKAGSFTYGLATQYYYNKFSGLASGATEDLKGNSLWGAKASLGYGDFGGYVAYSKVNDKGDNTLGGVVSGLGGGADLAYTASPINSNSYGNDTESYKVGLTYAVFKNASLGVNYTENKIDSALADEDKFAFTAVEADYAFEGALKGLSTSIIYEDGSKDASGTDELWAKINYKF